MPRRPSPFPRFQFGTFDSAQPAYGGSPGVEFAAADAEPEGEQWLHEIKYDGYRMRVRFDHGAVKLLTRTGLDWARKYTAIVRAVAALGARHPIWGHDMDRMAPFVARIRNTTKCVRFTGGNVCGQRSFADTRRSDEVARGAVIARTVISS